MATNNLTDAALRAVKPKSKPFKMSDGEGLHLLVQPGGGRLWRLAYRFRGKQKTLALGPYPLVTLAHARDQRQRAKLLLHEGKDPSEVRKIERLQSRADENTFSHVAKRWFASRRASWTQAYAERVESRIDNDLNAVIGARPVDEVSPSELLVALRAIEGRGAIETARRVKNYAHDIFGFAKSEKLG